MKMKKYVLMAVGACAALFMSSCGDKEKTSGDSAASYTLAWSPYTGWEPIAYMVDSGILKKHADKHGIEIKVKKFNDYVESITQYTSSDIDAVSLTNMDALTLPATSGVDSTFILPTDFSNGNDAIVSKGASSVAELKGKSLKLVEMSVSHYMLARALEKNGLTEKDVTVTHTSDAQIGSLFIAADESHVVTWNPIVNTIKSQPNAKILFDSSQIPGEIIDTIIVKTAADAKFKQAVTDAWYETMAVMAKKDAKAMEVISASAGGSLDDYNAQLKTTEMFYTKADAKKFFESGDVKKTMEFVRSFSFDKGLYPEGSSSKDDIGILFPDGSVMGNKDNIKLRFDTSFLK